MIKKKIWKLPNNFTVGQDLIDAACSSEILARLLWQRNIRTPQEIHAFLDPQAYQPTSPMVFADMAKAVTRIVQAIDLKEKITVYGDYDTDGVTATALTVSVLKQLGANVDFYIPNRATEGYGISLKAVSVLASKHRSKLIISCDCGIANFAEISLAKSLGVDTIITDHHTMPEALPPAVVILHPKEFPVDHPLANLPGVGVAYKLAEALLINAGKTDQVSAFLDFLTLGMIADMVPLLKENRYLVQVGLPALINSKRLGIQALLNNIGNFDDTDLVGFGLAPRINASGRLSDANLAVQLMITEDKQEAEKLAYQLERENERRQELCEKIFFEADQKARAHLSAQPANRALALYSTEWHHGVVGIVASRLVEKYHCPVFVGELNKREGKLKGSARGVSEIDLVAVLKENQSLLGKYGGHRMAAGFTAEATVADTLCQALVETCNRMQSTLSTIPEISIDLCVQATQVDLSLAYLLKKLGPFGIANKKPVLVLKEQTVLSSSPLGKEGKHQKLLVSDKESNKQFECVIWRVNGNTPKAGQIVDLAFSAGINKFNNTERLQLVLADWHVSGEEQALATRIPMEQISALSQQLIAPSSASTIPEQQNNLSFLPADASQASPETNIIPLTTSSSTSLAKPIEIKTPPLSSSPPITWKDLRQEASRELLTAAQRKLGSNVAIFSEGVEVDGITFIDRCVVTQAPHLLIWQYPPSLSVFYDVLSKTKSKNIYFVGAGEFTQPKPTEFLKTLLALVRFAVSKKDGEAQGDKLAAAMSTSKMSLALGLTILKKIQVIDWYSEDDIIYLDLLDTTIQQPLESLPEYKQLTNCLTEITEFRQWCATASLNELQLSVLPNVLSFTDNNFPYNIDFENGRIVANIS